MMTDDEWLDIQNQRTRWDEYLAEHPDVEWTSADGVVFTHMYKIFEKHRENAEGRG
jgi:hypothetical protein